MYFYAFFFLLRKGAWGWKKKEKKDEANSYNVPCKAAVTTPYISSLQVFEVLLQFQTWITPIKIPAV